MTLHQSAEALGQNPVHWGTAGSHSEPLNLPQQGRLGFQVREADRRDNRITVRSLSNRKRIRTDTKMHDSPIHLGPKDRADVKASSLSDKTIISSCLLDILKGHPHQQFQSNPLKTNQFFPFPPPRTPNLPLLYLLFQAKCFYIPSPLFSSSTVNWSKFNCYRAQTLWSGTLGASLENTKTRERTSLQLADCPLRAPSLPGSV